MKQYATLEDTVYFWFAANDVLGSGGDGATPLADVRLAGAAADAVPVFSPTPVLLTNAGYPDGCYEVAIAATNTNGFAANNTYAVFCTLAVDSRNPTGFIGSFDLKPVLANAKQIEGGDATDAIRDAVVDDATRIDASALNTLSGHDPGSTICADGTPLTSQETRDAMKLSPTGNSPAEGSVDKHLDEIEADTSDLQGNQAAWATAGAGDVAGAEVVLHADYDSAKVKFKDGKVYVATGGVSNTTYPAGEAPSPTDTLARGLSIAGTNNEDTLDVHGDHTTTGDMEGYCFVGHGHLRIAERIYINSHSVQHSSFRSLVVQGTMANTLGVLNVTRFDDCKLWALSDIHGISTNGVLLGTCSILAAGIGIFNDPGCGALAACTLTLQNPAVCVISNMRGVLTLAGMTGGTAYISMAHGSTLIIDSTNSGGTITVSGDTSGLTVDGSATTTVNIVKPVANTVQVSGTTQAANDNSTDINAILALLDDARTEPGQGTPSVNPNAMTKLDYLYKQWRNLKENDGIVRTLYNDAGDTVDQKSSVSEAAGTVTIGEVVSGP